MPLSKEFKQAFTLWQKKGGNIQGVCHCNKKDKIPTSMERWYVWKKKLNCKMCGKV